jgi:hypothetical protein
MDYDNNILEKGPSQINHQPYKNSNPRDFSHLASPMQPSEEQILFNSKDAYQNMQTIVHNK